MDKTSLSQYDLTKVIQKYIDAALKEVKTCLPAQVMKVYPTQQRVDVQPLIPIKAGDSEIMTTPRALVEDVPFVYPVFGIFRISLPIKVGDQGILIYAHRDIRYWKKLGVQFPPSSREIFRGSDCFFLVGVSPLTKAHPTYNADQLEIDVGLGQAKITIDAQSVVVDFNGKTATITPGSIEAPDYVLKCKEIETSGNITCGGNMEASGDVVGAECKAGSVTLTGHKHQYDKAMAAQGLVVAPAQTGAGQG